MRRLLLEERSGRPAAVPDGADALDERLLRRGNQPLFEPDHAQGFNAPQQLAGLEQEIRIARPSVALVSPGEGFIDENAAGAQRRDEIGEKRPVEVICNNHAVELPGRERPGPCFDVRDAKLGAAEAGERAERLRVAVDADHRETERGEVAQVAAHAARHVEHAPARADRAGPADDPGGRRLEVVRTRLHIASIIPRAHFRRSIAWHPTAAP